MKINSALKPSFSELKLNKLEYNTKIEQTVQKQNEVNLQLKLVQGKALSNHPSPTVSKVGTNYS